MEAHPDWLVAYTDLTSPPQPAPESFKTAMQPTRREMDPTVGSPAKKQKGPEAAVDKQQIGTPSSFAILDGVQDMQMDEKEDVNNTKQDQEQDEETVKV